MLKVKLPIYYNQYCPARIFKIGIYESFLYTLFYMFTFELHMPHTYFSMTTLLTHTVAHSTKPSFRPKTNNQPLKKSFAQLSKICQKWPNSDFQSQFSMSRNIRIFLKKKFIKEYDFRGSLFVIDIF